MDAHRSFSFRSYKRNAQQMCCGYYHTQCTIIVHTDPMLDTLNDSTLLFFMLFVHVVECYVSFGTTGPTSTFSPYRCR
jgi:hypothetical protein